MRFILLLARRRRCRALRQRAGRSWNRAGSLWLRVGRRRRGQLLYIRRHNTFHRWDSLHLSGFGVRNINAELGERFRGGLVQLHLGFFVVGSGVENGRFRLGQIAGRLQYQSRSRGAMAKLLLLRYQALLGKVPGRHGRMQSGVILLYRNWGLPYLDGDGVLDLLQAHLGLAVFQLGAYLFGLRGPDRKSTRLNSSHLVISRARL